MGSSSSRWYLLEELEEDFPLFSFPLEKKDDGRYSSDIFDLLKPASILKKIHYSLFSIILLLYFTLHFIILSNELRFTQNFQNYESRTRLGESAEGGDHAQHGAVEGAIDLLEGGFARVVDIDDGDVA